MIADLFEAPLELLLFARLEEYIPYAFTASLNERLPGHLFAGPIATDYSAFQIKHHDQGTYRVENGRDNITFFLQLQLGLLEVGNVEGNAMDEPRSAVGTADHSGFALEPDHPAVASHDTVGRSQGLAGKKHFGSFHAPAIFVIGMDLLVPEHRIFQPFRLGEPQCRFDLRTHIGLANTTIEVGHEHDCWKLFHQRPVSGLGIG